MRSVDQVVGWVAYNGVPYAGKLLADTHCCPALSPDLIGPSNPLS